MKVKVLMTKGFKQFMELKGWKLRDMAKKMGYAESQCSAIVNRQIEPSYRFLKKLAKLTYLKVEELIETEFDFGK